MPRIWLDYLQFMMDQRFVSRTRHLFDRSLRALPITQHGRIWPKYLAFIGSLNLPETAVRVYRRYLKVLNFLIICLLFFKKKCFRHTFNTLSSPTI